MVWSGDGAGSSIATDAGSPTERALPQPTVAKHVTSVSPPERETWTTVFHLHGSRHRDDRALKPQS